MIKGGPFQVLKCIKEVPWSIFQKLKKNSTGSHFALLYDIITNIAGENGHNGIKDSAKKILIGFVLHCINLKNVTYFWIFVSPLIIR